MTRLAKPVHLVLTELANNWFLRRKFDKNHKNPILIFDIFYLRMRIGWLGSPQSYAHVLCCHFASSYQFV